MVKIIPNKHYLILKNNFASYITSITYISALIEKLIKTNKLSKIYTSGAFFPSYAAIINNINVEYFTHGLIGKTSSILMPKFNKIFVFSDEEKKYLLSINVKSIIEKYSYNKTTNHNTAVILFLRQTDDKMIFEDIENVIKYFKNNKFVIFLKKHPKYAGFKVNKLIQKYSLVEIPKNLNAIDCFNKYKPLFVVSYKSTSICEALLSNIIPISVASQNQIEPKLHSNSPNLDWTIYPLKNKSISWFDEKYIIDNILLKNKNYFDFIKKFLLK